MPDEVVKDTTSRADQIRSSGCRKTELECCVFIPRAKTQKRQRLGGPRLMNCSTKIEIAAAASNV